MHSATLPAVLACAADDLSAAKIEAQQLSESIDGTLGDLETVCRELCSLAGQPQLWLLCAADQTGYKHMDDHINAQHLRSVLISEAGCILTYSADMAGVQPKHPTDERLGASTGYGGLI
jgi:hypothetical protein